MSQDKFSKQQLKEDKFVEKLIEAKELAQTNKNYIVYALVAFTVIILIGYFIYYQRQDKKEFAARTIFDIEMSYIQNQFSGQQTIDRTIKTAEDSLPRMSGTTEGEYALIILANAYYQKGDYNKSIEKYKEYLDEYNDTDLFSVAALEGWGNSLVQLAKYQEAAEKYKEASNNQKDFYAVPFLLQKAANCYKMANNNPKSIELYERIIKEFKTYPELEAVKISLGEISDLSLTKNEK